MATSTDYSRSVVEASDEVRDTYCEPCVDDGKQNEAEGLCVDCSEYLCGQCYKNHTRYKAFKQHVLQDKDKMPVCATNAGAKDVCVEKCSLHTTKTVEYFCRSCDTLGCHACITINHCLCKNVDHIPSIVNVEKSEEFKEFINGLDIRLEAAKERKKTLCSNSNETDVMKGKAKSMLIQQRDEIKKFFDQLETDMNKRIEALDRENQETLKAESSACDSIYDDLETIKTKIKTKLKDGQKCELFIAMKNDKPKTKKLDKEFEKLTKESKIQSYVLTPSSQIKQVMESTSEICRLHRLRSAKYVHEINVRTKNDKNCPHIFNQIMVQNQYLAVADNDNTSVKMVDTRSMSVKSEMNMNCTYVWHITCMSDDKIAVHIVTGGYQNHIQFMSVCKEGSLSKGHLVNIDETCYGLAYSRGNFFILQDQQVQIDIHGKIQDTIKTDYSESLGGIAISPDNETIYFTNFEKNTVSSMTLDGKVKAVYKDLNGPVSVTVDNDGMVYVCGSDTRCMHLLTEDLIKLQVIKDIYGTNITYSSTDNRLYVGLQDVITVYQMEQ
ncbi:uncharacterized protein LOC128559263 [Mercenaria mercenaria]|uniref:uncharacterized protein LOC128559263 n=1 Tax=Mercenaria mercenaria TaxID=6596 RepID=UPI00234F4F77|nr:uncharacterized protein LOC128559263 [Mercenaria mercenaria]